MRTPNRTASLLAGLAFAALAATPALAQCPNDDSFEDNDDCSSVSVLPVGSTTGLVVQGAANATGLDEDYWVVQGVPSGQVLTVDAFFTHATTGDIDLRLFSDPGCLTQLDASATVTSNEQVSGANGTGSPVDFYVRVEAWGSSFDCNDYDLQVTLAPDPCQAGTDDSFEENDACGAAVPLAVGVHAGLFVSDSDPDFYLVDVPAGEVLTVDGTYLSGANADVDLRIYDDLACTNEVDSVFPTTGLGTVEWANATGALATVVVTAEVAPGEGCNSYDLNLTTALDPCLDPLADDALEDNDDCANALLMTDGLYPDLFVSKADEDFYEVQVADGDTITVDILHSVANGDADLYLYDDQVSCGDLASYLDRGYTSSDNETVTWTNTSGTTATYYVQVVIWANSDDECNDDYDLQISGAGANSATPFCFGDGTADAGGGPVGCPCGNESALGAGEGCESSLGVGAVLTASGSSVVANDDLAFSVAQAIPNQPSLLVQGATPIAAPFKDGVLCMGTPTERVEVVFLDAAGAGSTAGSIVTNGNVSPGDTRYYQQWFRDPGGVSPCGTGSNFSQGLVVVWQ